MNTRRLLLLALLPLTFAATSVGAQDYPNKAIRILVGFSPGGAADAVGRMLQAPLSKALGVPVVVENKTGASGLIATTEVVKATPDGYTLGVIVSTHASSPAIRSNMPFDPVKDVAPVALIGKIPLVIGTHPSVKANTIQEYVALVKSLPEGHNYATAGAGLAHHFAGELFARRADIKLVHTPYRGAGPQMVDMIGGQIPMGIAAVPTIIKNVEAGKLKALAVTSARRAPNMPNVPTIAESGYPGFDVSEWYGVVTTAGTPRAVVERLAKEIDIIMQSPEAKKWIENNAIIRDITTPDDFAAFIRNEVEKLAKIAKDANIKVD
ncbi:MAG: tripartite tricarboxylate transporter substrate binding protein [Betaproteobacteria bacterium]|nr:tripartite tricarboxylate transporter substrate binding protein [Betaproteobacteria bacterium]